MPTTSTQFRSSRASTDPRANRSRSALFDAAIELVTRAATSDISLASLATESGLSRQAIYLHFPDRDAVLIAAAVDLLSRELIEPARQREEPLTPIGLAEHFYRHRTFYAALMRGSCVGQAQPQTARGVPASQRETCRRPYRDPRSKSESTTLPSLFLTGGSEKLVTTWMLSANPEPTHRFAARLTAVVEALTHTQLNAEE